MVERNRRVAELREGLVEEGRRRRLLYEERTWAAQSELRRVLAEKTAVEEKDGMLRLLLKVALGSIVSLLFFPPPFRALCARAYVLGTNYLELELVQLCSRKRGFAHASDRHN